MTRHKDTPAAAAMQWSMLGMDAWQLGMESCWVIGLRMARLSAGGAAADQEATRMVEEKWRAQTDLAFALASGQFGSDPARIAGRTIEHYSGKVRANRKRLTR